VKKLRYTEATFYGWKQKLGGTDVSAAQQLKILKDENRQLNLLVAKVCLHGEALKAVIRKRLGPCRSKRRGGIRLFPVPVDRKHGLQAAGDGAVEPPIWDRRRQR
jgi:hypothetical protein